MQARGAGDSVRYGEGSGCRFWTSTNWRFLSRPGCASNAPGVGLFAGGLRGTREDAPCNVLIAVMSDLVQRFGVDGEAAVGAQHLRRETSGNHGDI